MTQWHWPIETLAALPESDTVALAETDGSGTGREGQQWHCLRRTVMALRETDSNDMPETDSSGTA